MTERLLLAVALLAAIAAIGAAIRSAAGKRAARWAVGVTLPRSETGLPRLLVFSTRFCGDCATQRHLIEASRATWPQPVEISFLDALAERDTAERLGILTVPAIVVARGDGRVVGVRQGLVGVDRLRSLLDAAA